MVVREILHLKGSSFRSPLSLFSPFHSLFPPATCHIARCHGYSSWQNKFARRIWCGKRGLDSYRNNAKIPDGKRIFGEGVEKKEKCSPRKFESRGRETDYSRGSGYGNRIIPSDVLTSFNSSYRVLISFMYSRMPTGSMTTRVTIRLIPANWKNVSVSLSIDLQKTSKTSLPGRDPKGFYVFHAFSCSIEKNHPYCSLHPSSRHLEPSASVFPFHSSCLFLSVSVVEGCSLE